MIPYRSMMHEPPRLCLMSVGNRDGLAGGGDDTGGGMPGEWGNTEIQPVHPAAAEAEGR